MTSLVLVYDRALKGLGVLGGLVFGLMAIMISLDVLLRNMGIVSFPWLLELSEYALYMTTFLVAPWVLRLGSHVRVDILFSFLGPGSTRIVNMVADVLGLAASAALGWYASRITWDAYVLGEVVFKELVVPEWWLLIVIPVSCIFLLIEFLCRLVRGPDARSAEKTLTEGF
jgi:TRAP-type C4-dicarboxylate transport system permease small subunit